MSSIIRNAFDKLLSWRTSEIEQLQSVSEYFNVDNYNDNAISKFKQWVVRIGNRELTFKNRKVGAGKLVASLGKLTFKGKTIGEIAAEDFDVQGTLNKSAGRGHASMTTKPKFDFEIKGSNAVDLYGTSFPHGTYLISSARRVKFDKNDFVVPDPALDVKEIFEEAYGTLWEVYDKIDRDTGKRDHARKILPIGYKTVGDYQYSLEQMVQIIEESTGEGMPYEMGLMADEFKKILNKKAPELLEACDKRIFPTNYPHQNIFHTRAHPELEREQGLWESRIDPIITEYLNKLREDWTRTGWDDFVDGAVDLVDFKFYLNPSLAIWSDFKRHRTSLQKAESVYAAADRAYDSLTRGIMKDIYVPPSVSTSKTLQEDYLNITLTALRNYREAIDAGVAQEDAIYMVPKNIRIRMSITLNGHHVFHPLGFFGVRQCSSADNEATDIANWMAEKVRAEFRGKGIYADDLIGPKCKIGYCLEEKPCGTKKQYTNPIKLN